MKNRIVTIIGLFALLSTASAAGPKADFNVIPGAAYHLCRYVGPLCSG